MLGALRAPDQALMREIMARARGRTAAVQARRRLRPRGLRGGARRVARAARRVAPGDRAAAGPLRRRDRRQDLEDPAQQRARLFRRGDRAARREADGRAAQRHLHPSPDAGRTSPLHHHRTRRTRSEDRQRRRPRARPRAGDLRAARRRGDRRQRRRSRPPPRRSPCSTSRARSRRSRSSATMCGPRSTVRSTSSIEGGRHPVVEQALERRRSSPTIATCRRRTARRPGASGCSPARTWPASRPSCARTR